jgi:hypothetical protein
MADAAAPCCGDDGRITARKEVTMYAIGRLSESLVTPPIPRPRTGRIIPERAERPNRPERASFGRRHIDAWFSFLPRLRSYPR